MQLLKLAAPVTKLAERIADRIADRIAEEVIQIIERQLPTIVETVARSAVDELFERLPFPFKR